MDASMGCEASGSEYPVVFENVSKAYGRVVALDGVSFRVARGSVHALLGHNGAGKTTSIRLMLGLLRPSAGRVETLGVDPYRCPRVRLEIGYCGEAEGLYQALTVRDNLMRFCTLKLGDASECRREVDEIAEMFSLDELLDRKVASLSAGNRQRVAVARAFIGKPRLVVLDEPMNKLDPVWRRRIRELLKSYAARNGATVVFSTHILQDAEEIADTVTILRRGRVVYHGSLTDLLSRGSLTARIVSRDAGLLEALRRVFGPEAVAEDGEAIIVRLGRDEELYQLLSLLSELKPRLDRLEARRLTLEDVYLSLYGGGGGGAG